MGGVLDEQLRLLHEVARALASRRGDGLAAQSGHLFARSNDAFGCQQPPEDQQAVVCLHQNSESTQAEDFSAAIGIGLDARTKGFRRQPMSVFFGEPPVRAEISPAGMD
jgi:hypothetical protein